MAAKKKNVRKASKKKASRSRSRSRSAPRRASAAQARRPDVLALLREDHERVQGLFDRFENTRGNDRKSKLAEQVCMELQIHACVEEELFYPAVREATGDEDLVNEATVEHQSAKDLIAKIQAMSADDEMFDATVKVLGEYVKHHVKEEQNEMFPKARKSGIDLKELGERVRDRKEALMSGSPLGKLRRMLM
ncbi:MAG: hemerythrin [Proteobacteria bacterium]|nr:MAG: hemerythrin [Pseudomonadota bacterium]